MNVVFVASEAVPFSKTGGLADIAGALPREIAALGHKVALFVPYYRVTKKVEPKPRTIAEGQVPVGAEMFHWSLLQSASEKGNVKVYFIDNEGFFDREGLYGTARGDYEDSCSRYVFFSRACLAAAQALNLSVDVWHCHDWQTAMIPIYLKLTLNKKPFYENSASIFTIHNLAYQGLFWHWDWPLLNLPWQHYNWKELEFHGKMSLLKGALVHADLLTTVSPTYAREIQTPEFGCGLEGVLAEHKDDLIGIVNGIDPAAWNPSTDPLLPANYSARSFDGKKTCKEVLRRKFGLSNDSSIVVGMVGRLFEQKGFDLVAQSIEELLRRDIQLVILGTGREEFHKMLTRVQQVNPKKMGVAFAFDNALAHLIEAGSDMFLMPSRYEPCGLNQLYSLAYGTPPIVRKVGGLADTIVDATPQSNENGTATGFSFEEYSAPAMLACIDRALQVLTKQPAVWRKIQTTGMSQDWSWNASAKKYVEVYQRAVAKKKGSGAKSQGAEAASS